MLIKYLLDGKMQQIMHRLLYGLLGIFSSFLCISPTYANMTAGDWLRAMHHAVHHLQYTGRFVYQVGSDMEVMQMQHERSAEQEFAHLHSLNGTPHEIVRRKGQPGTAPPHQPIPISGIQKHTLGLNCLFKYQQMALYYRPRLKDQHRVAGRMTQIIEIEPKDKLRFGQRLYLDLETKLPLRSILLSPDGETLAQTLFVDLQIKPATANKQPIHHPSGKPTLLDHTITNQRWQFHQLPAGFTIQLHHYQPVADREHFVFSDGLSVISLYIEPWLKTGLKGYSKKGATWVLGVHKHNRRITLLGEVPRVTLQYMADAIHPVQ